MAQRAVRPLLVAAIALCVAGLAGCADDEALPGADELRAIDTSPTVVLEISAAGLEPAGLEVEVGDVLAIRNADDVDHRLVGDDLDTGTLRPGEQTLLLFDEPATIALTDLVGSVEGTLTVVAAPLP